MRQLVERGFTAPDGLLVVLDGAKGLRAAIRTVFGPSAQVQRCQRTGRMTRWQMSDQKQRWCAAALLAMEPRLRHVKGSRHLRTLATALGRESRPSRDAA